MTYENSPPPPPGGGTPGYEPPPGGFQGGGFGGLGSEHPEGMKLLVISIIALICCAPVNIWVLVKANGILANPGGYNLSKVTTARIIAIVSLVLWALGIVVNIFTGGFAALMGDF